MQRIVVGISGASGAAVALDVLRQLQEAGTETHLVVSKWGGVTLEHECGVRARDLHALASAVYSNGDLAAPISSGSFRVDATLIVPCSARTLGAMASGAGDTLISRAGDVALKERRRLVLALRESPLSPIHLRNALTLVEAGGVIAPLMPAFYARPSTLETVVSDMAARLVELCGVEAPALPRWGETLDLHRERSVPAPQSPPAEA